MIVFTCNVFLNSFVGANFTAIVRIKQNGFKMRLALSVSSWSDI